MTQSAFPVSNLSPLSSRRKVPAESNVTNSLSIRSHSSPRQIRLTVASVLGQRGLSLSPRVKNVTSISAVGDVHRSTASAIKCRTKPPALLDSPRQAYMEIGLENLGNTCFMNSSLQCLLHIQPLVSYFLATDIDKVLNDSSPMKGSLALSFAHFVREVCNASAGSSVAPMDFQKVVGYYAPHLLDNQQQDCQEFLRFLLDGLSEDLCRKKIAKKVGLCDGTQKCSKKRLIISSRTRDRINAGRSQVNTSITDGEFIEPSKTQDYISKDSSYKDSLIIGSVSESTVSDRISIDKVSVDEDGEYHEGRSQRYSSATRLREEIGYASSQNATRSHSISTSRKESFDDERNFMQAPENMADIAVTTGAINIPVDVDTNHGILETKECSPKESSFNYETFQISNDVAKMSLSLNDLPARDDIVVVENICHSGGRRRFKLPNISILGPMSAFSLVRTETKINTGGNPAVRTESETFVNSMGPDEILVSTSMKLNSKKTTRKSFITKNILNPARRRGSRGSENSVENNDVTNMTDNRSLEESRLTAIEGSKVAWASYLDFNSSVITDIFAGQLQSTIECLTCKNRTFCFDPFLDLSVPIPRKIDTKGKWRRQVSKEVSKCPLEECIEKFTGEEILEGDNMYLCSKCCEKRKCTKKLSIFKYPRVLVIHIKRFRYSEISREKLSTDVIFPLKGLDLGPYLSIDRLASPVNLSSSAIKEKIQLNEIKSINIPNSSSLSVTCTSSLSIDSTDVDPSSYINSNSISNGSTGTYDSKMSSNSKNIDCSQNPAESNISQGEPENNDEIDRSHLSIPLPLSSVEEKNNCDTTESSKFFDSNQFLPIYDLISVSNHCGTLNGGHYIAHVDTTSTSNTHICKEQNHTEEQVQQQQQQLKERQNVDEEANHQSFNSNDTNCLTDEDCLTTDPNSKVVQSQPSNCEGQCNNIKITPRWMCFNDEHVSPASSTNIVGPSAYVLFYRLRES